MQAYVCRRVHKPLRGPLPSMGNPRRTTGENLRKHPGNGSSDHGISWSGKESHLGHTTGKAATAEAIVALWRLVSEELILMTVQAERNKGVNGTNRGTFIFGNRRALVARSCRTEKTSGDRTARGHGSLSHRILRAYPRKRARFNTVGSLLRVFQGKRIVMDVLTVNPSRFQTSSGRELNNALSLP